MARPEETKGPRRLLPDPTPRSQSDQTVPHLSLPEVTVNGAGRNRHTNRKFVSPLVESFPRASPPKNSRVDSQNRRWKVAA